jgi:ABC-type glycerol-3-phosphate transport system substrate-binding protein
MRAQTVFVALALVLAPLGVRAADLVAWWDEGFYAEEDEAVREIIAAFEQETGKEVQTAGGPRRATTTAAQQIATTCSEPGASYDVD